MLAVLIISDSFLEDWLKLSVLTVSNKAANFS